MKKFFTLCIALFSAVAMFAQETKGMYEFADKDGNVVPSGSELTRTEAVDDGMGSVQIHTGLYMKPIKTELNGEKVCVKMRVEIQEIDNGSLQYCLLGNCQFKDAKGTYETSGGYVDKLDDLQTEWNVGTDDDDNALPGKAKVKLTLVACKKVSSGKDQFGVEQFDYEDIGDCADVTVKFVYGGSTGINGISNADATVVARYAADGTRLSAPQKGLNIVKLSNGKTVKYIK